MKIVFAQGNPGSEYTASRHNIGFMILDALAGRLDTSFTHKAKFAADIAEVTLAGEKVLLVKPRTFYNETGKSARALCDFYKCTPATDFLVIHDDLALPLGTIRVRQQGSDAGNNGIKSLNAHLGGTFWRLRLGIYNELRDRMHDAQFVLGNFSRDETSFITSTLIPETTTLLQHFFDGNLEAASKRLTLSTDKK